MSDWTALAEAFYYPMTRLWPLVEVKRRVHYFNRLVPRIDLIFENYEESGGQYHVEDTDEDDDAGGAEPAEGDSDPDDDDMFDSC